MHSLVQFFFFFNAAATTALHPLSLHDALPIFSWKGTLVQYTGRLHRLNPGKSEVRINDYVDREVPLLARMFKKDRKSTRLNSSHQITSYAVSCLTKKERC